MRELKNRQMITHRIGLYLSWGGLLLGPLGLFSIEAEHMGSTNAVKKEIYWLRTGGRTKVFHIFLV